MKLLKNKIINAHALNFPTNYGFILKSGKIINNTATHRQISNL